MKISARYTDKSQTQGIITVDGVDWSTAFPPEAGDLRPHFDKLLNEGKIEPFTLPVSEPEPDAGPVPDVVSDRQFFQQLAMDERITQKEAINAVKTGAIPATMQSLISALPVDQQFPATMLISGATTFERNHPLVGALGASLKMSKADLDNLWRNAAKL